MERNILFEKDKMYCPFCDRIHKIEQRTQVTTFFYKEKEIIYKERFYYYPKTEGEFQSGLLMNKNLSSIRKALRES